MRKPFVRSVVCGVFLLAIGSVATASAQQEPWRVVQGSDGTLYLVTGTTRYVINPDQVSDDDLAALTDGGVIGSQLPLATVAPTPIVVLTPAPPEPAVIALTATPVPATSTPVPAEQPLTVSGRNDENSKPLSLRGGNYTISWSAKSMSAYKDNRFYGFFGAVNTPNNFLTSFGGLVDASNTASGQTNIYNLPRGQYFINGSPSGTDVNMTWTVTVAPQSEAALTIAPAPPPAAADPLPALDGPFTGAPEDIALRASDLGPGWSVLDQHRDPADVTTTGTLTTRFASTSGATVIARVTVFRSRTAAVAGWIYGTIAGGSLNICDASWYAGSSNPSAPTPIHGECLVQNVLIGIEGTTYQMSQAQLASIGKRVTTR